ncbi:MAG: terminase small subunit [Proteobacteria bacterium]|nr:terminase small subunit [Pseudomonadota bacterium]
MPRDDPPMPTTPAAAGPNTAAAPPASPDDSTDPLPPRQEAFCHYFVLWGNASVAASEAGYARGSARNQGYRLGRRPAIRARIAELRRGLARAYGLDAEVLVGKLEALYQRAVEDHHFYAAARCVEIQARLAGLRQGFGRRRPRGEDGPRGSGGVPRDPQGPDRDINMMTNDDIHGPFAAPKQAQSRT